MALFQMGKQSATLLGTLHSVVLSALLPHWLSQARLRQYLMKYLTPMLGSHYIGLEYHNFLHHAQRELHLSNKHSNHWRQT